MTHSSPANAELVSRLRADALYQEKCSNGYPKEGFLAWEAADEIERLQSLIRAQPTASPESAELLPCPFCGSTNVDPEGWMSVNEDGTQKETGPACDECGGSTESVERWNTRNGIRAQQTAAPANADTYAASLRQQADLMEKANAGKVSAYVAIDDFDVDELRESADFIERISAQQMTEPVAWRILCTTSGATGYLYTECLPFHPGPGVNQRREPEPLYAFTSPKCGDGA